MFGIQMFTESSRNNGTCRKDFDQTGSARFFPTYHREFMLYSCPSLSLGIGSRTPVDTRICGCSVCYVKWSRNSVQGWLTLRMHNQGCGRLTVLWLFLVIVPSWKRLLKFFRHQEESQRFFLSLLDLDWFQPICMPAWHILGQFVLNPYTIPKLSTWC